MNTSGFTLIEVILTLSLIALLATFTSFSYFDFILRFRRIEGQTTLMQLAIAMEEYYTHHLSYSEATLQTLGYSLFSPHAYYRLTLEASENTYLLTATPHGAQEKDRCGTLTLTYLNQKEPADCW